MKTSYLIPANTKSGTLIFNLFTQFDLILFGSGIFLTFMLFIAIPTQSVLLSLLAISPGLITGFLVLPIPNYHNVLTFIKSLIRFYSERRMFIWKGWCIHEFGKK